MPAAAQPTLSPSASTGSKISRVVEFSCSGPRPGTNTHERGLPLGSGSRLLLPLCPPLTLFAAITCVQREKQGCRNTAELLLRFLVRRTHLLSTNQPLPPLTQHLVTMQSA
jgi:hypothetical protein